MKFLILLVMLIVSQSFARPVDDRAAAFANKVRIGRDFDGDQDAKGAARKGTLDDPNIEKYRTLMADVYHRAPTILQNYFDHLDIVFVESGPEFTPDAWSTVVEGRAYLGFRRKILDERIGLATNFASYEQNFMKDRDGKSGLKDAVNPNLPFLVPNPRYNTILHTLIGLSGHEFGHALLLHEPELLDRWIRDGGWQNKDVLADPELREIGEKLCLRSNCGAETKIPVEMAMQFYKTMEAKGILSWFSFRNAKESFCEAMSFFILSMMGSSETQRDIKQLVYQLPNGETVNLFKNILDPTQGSLARKRLRMVRKASRRTNPILDNGARGYPGLCSQVFKN